MQHYESCRKIMDSYSQGTDSFELHNSTAQLTYISSQVLQHDRALPAHVLLATDVPVLCQPPRTR